MTTRLQGAPAGTIRFAVLAWLIGAACFAYLCRNSIVVTEKTMRLDLGLTERQMGWILGPAFFWTYALAQIPTAWCAQRWGARRVLPVMMVISSLATAALAHGRDTISLALARVFGGLGQAGIFPASVQTIGHWHPATERAVASGALAAAMSIGGAIGVAATGWLLETQGCSWRTIFLLWALPGLGWAAGFAWWFRDTPQQFAAARRRLPPQAAAEVPPDAKLACSDPAGIHHIAYRLLISLPLWLICGQQFFRAAGYAFFTSWFATYLQETRGVSTGESGLLTMLPLVAIVISSLAGGAFSDGVYRLSGNLSLARRGVATVALAASAMLVFATYWIDNTAMAMATLSAGVFCSGLAGPCAYAVTMDLGGRHVAVIFSTMNMIGNFGAGLLPWFVPFWRIWWESDVLRLAWVGGNSWHAVLWLFAGMYLAAALCWLALPLSGTIIQEPAERTDEASGRSP